MPRGNDTLLRRWSITPDHARGDVGARAEGSRFSRSRSRRASRRRLRTPDHWRRKRSRVGDEDDRGRSRPTRASSPSPVFKRRSEEQDRTRDGRSGSGPSSNREEELLQLRKQLCRLEEGISQERMRSRQRERGLAAGAALAAAARQEDKRYHSQLEKDLKAHKKPQLCRDFGYAEVSQTPPDKFLKKGEGLTQPIKKSDHKCFVSGNLPPVPRRPPPGKKSDKPKVNFVVVNIKKAVKVKGKPVEPRLVDTRDGHRKTIKGSGEVPEYCIRPDFGQMPAYLVKRNRRIQKALDKARYAEENKESICKLINEQERQKLLEDLKFNWQLMQKAFLQLPMLTDTIPKILRKSKMENELRQLEKDIALVEDNPYIYIFEQ